MKKVGGFYQSNKNIHVVNEMTNKTEVTLAWIIVGIVAVPMCILHPGVLVAGILGYALWTLYNHYKR